MGLCCGKSSVPVVEENRPIYNSQKSVELPDASDVSLKKDEKTSRWQRFFGHVSEQKAADDQTPNGQTKTSENTEKPSWIFGKKRNQVHPIQLDVTPKKLCPAAPHNGVTFEFKPPLEKKVTTEIKPPLEKKVTAKIKPPLEKKVAFEIKPPLEKKVAFEIKPHLEKKVTAKIKPPLEKKVAFEIKPPLEKKVAFEIKPPLEKKVAFEIKPPLEKKVAFEFKPPLEKKVAFEIKPHLEKKVAFEFKPHLEKKVAFEFKPPLEKKVTTKIKPPQEKKVKKTDVAKNIIKTLKIRVKEAPSTLITKFFRRDQFKCLGLPNPAQNCYMNSCLQSLLTLEDFGSTIICQEQVWGSHPEAALLRSFMEVKKAYLSPDLRQKIPLLCAFKRAVSLRAPQFTDLEQKDAHEFLTSVFQQMRNLGPELTMMAACMGKSYSCPVETLMTFKMENTRTCRRCGEESRRQEVFTNLSLDMIPGCGSVDELLMGYLKEIDLEYRCDCGSILSGQTSSFATLPRVLVLHLKRFRYSPSYRLEKVCDPILLNRDLIVSTNQDDRCYSLVSIVNHMGKHAGRGHYICDGVDPDVKVEDPTDRWFTYDDAWVTMTSGASVCNQRQKSAYILFYKIQD